MKVENYFKIWAGSGFRCKEGRDGGINRKKKAGWRDLRTLLWTLFSESNAFWNLIQGIYT